MAKRDNQQSKLYGWQNGFKEAVISDHPRLGTELPLEVCQRFADKIAAHYGIETPKVIKHRRKYGKTAHYTFWNNTITLPVGWACNGFTMAHEMSHCIADNLFGLGIESHGAEFTRVYANVLSIFFGLDALQIEESMKAAGLKVLETSPIPKLFTKALYYRSEKKAASQN